MTRTAKIVGTLLGMLFGCWHQRLSWPHADEHGTYQRCLDCGARRPSRLKLVTRVRKSA